MEEPESDSIHFSHQHALQYLESPTDKDYICSGCKLAIMPGIFCFQCKLCLFFLHKVCYRMPIKLLHPADPNHHLTLLAKPTSRCEACGKHISGFCYRCTKCNLSYHMLCIALPLSLKIPSLHLHTLKLELKPPYDFQCDLCHKSSYSGWLYRCRLCEFDAHISCAVTYNKVTTRYHKRKADYLDSISPQNELMEILSQGMKVMEEKNSKDAIHEPQDQSSMVSENFTLPSYQLSGSCFSIDIAKSIQEDELQAGKSMKRELSLAPLAGIGSQVWTELGHPNVDRTQFKNLTTNTEDAIPKRRFWSKLLICL
ncbi:protein VACUOLELESS GAMETOPHYTES-like [Primulina huaijiensis]|uniref:protein VACUOLELESS GAMETOPHYTES-like n=1 Tax=Primulina huaijiensis TaxID=1492673 RepID=UPI003CC76987